MPDRQKPRVEGLFSTLAMVVLGMSLAGLIFSLSIQDYRHELGLSILAATFLAAAASKALEDFWRTGFLTMGIVVAMVSVAEVYFTFSARGVTPRDVDQSFSGTLSQSHLTLGYAPPTSTSITVERTVADAPTDVIYDITYTLDENARRIGPNENRNADCVLFFGGSFTWGEGVEDHETMPHQVAEASGHTLRALNFGFSGYGANHMLRAMDDGALDTSCMGAVQAVVYTAIPPHYLRSAGLVSWGPKSPKYRYAEDLRRIMYAGPMFEDMIAFRAFRKKHESALINQILILLARPDALDLYAAIVRAAEDRVTVRNATPFIVLYWDLMDEGADPQLNRLIEGGFAIMRVSGLLSRDQMTTMRIANDGHPSPEAYRLLGQAFYEKLKLVLPPSQ